MPPRLQADASRHRVYEPLGVTRTHMPTANAFNATEWIAQNTRGGTKLSPEAREAVASFTTMWNFFESTLCENHASVAAFERACERLEPDHISASTIQALEECLTFWRFRYRTPDGFGHRFENLYFRPNDRRTHVESVLEENSASLKDKLLALMSIVYRLRNNLFHGLKTLDMLNDQVQNLATASRCLAAVLEAIPSRFVSVRRQRTTRSGHCVLANSGRVFNS